MDIFSLRGTVDILMGEALKQLGQVDKGAQQAGASLGNLSKTGEQAGAKVGSSANFMNSTFGQVLLTIGKVEVAMAGFQKIFAPLIGATKLAMDFEKQMRNVNSIAHLSEAAFANMSDKVRDLGTSLGVSTAPAEAAAAQYDIMSSGFTDSAKSMEVLKASLIAGSAGLADAAVAARAITAVMNAYGQETMTAAHVSDVMFQTVNLGVVTFEQLAQHIGGVTSIAATAGVSFEELSAVVAQLTVKGIRAPIAIDSLRAAISQLLAPSEEARKEMREFGITVDANTLKQKGLIGTLVEITQKTGGNAQALKAILGDINAVNAAMALTADGGKAATAALEQMNNAGGAAGAALAEQNKSAAKQLENLIAAIKQLGIEIGENLLPYVKTMIEDVSAVVHFFGNFNDELSKLERNSGVLGTIARGVKGIGDAASATKQALVGAGIMGGEAGGPIAVGRGALRSTTAKGIIGDISKRTTQEKAADISNLREERNQLTELNRGATDKMITADQAATNVPRTSNSATERATNDAERQRLELVVQMEQRGIESRNKRIAAIKEELAAEQKLIVAAREKDAVNHTSSVKQVANAYTISKEEGAAIEKGKQKWKDWTDFREKNGFKTKRDEIKNLDEVIAHQGAAFKFGATTMKEVKETRAKLAREIAQQDIKTDEAANASIAQSATHHAKHLVTIAQDVLAARQRTGTASIADQQQVTIAVTNEAAKERDAKLVQIANSRADLLREGKMTVTAEQAFARQRGEAQEIYTDKVRVEAARRADVEKAEMTAVLGFQKTQIDQRIALLDVQKARLDFLASHGVNVEANYRDLVQQRINLELQAMQAQMKADLAGATTAEQVWRIRTKYATDEATMRKKFANEEEQRQYEWADKQRQIHEQIQDETYRLTHTEAQNEVLDMQRKIEEFRRNGVSEVEIAAWVAAKKADLLKKEKEHVDGVTDAVDAMNKAWKWHGGGQSVEDMAKSHNARFSLSLGTGTSGGGVDDAMQKAGFGSVAKPVLTGIPNVGGGTLPGLDAMNAAGAAALPGGPGTGPGAGGITSGTGPKGNESSMSSSSSSSTQKVELVIDLSGKITAVSGPLAQDTVNNLSRDLGLAMRLGGDTTKGLGRS